MGHFLCLDVSAVQRLFFGFLNRAKPGQLQRLDSGLVGGWCLKVQDTVWPFESIAGHALFHEQLVAVAKCDVMLDRHIAQAVVIDHVNVLVNRINDIGPARIKMYCSQSNCRIKLVRSKSSGRSR